MDVLMTVLVALALVVLAAKWGVDSRPADADRATDRNLSSRTAARVLSPGR